MLTKVAMCSHSVYSAIYMQHYFHLSCTLHRFIYSVERNRRSFRRLLPPKLFELFIDTGHYIRDSSAYSPLVHYVKELSVSSLIFLKEFCGDILSHCVGGLKAFSRVYATMWNLLMEYSFQAGKLYPTFFIQSLHKSLHYHKS